MERLQRASTALYIALVSNDRGATAVEYGIIVALIAGVIITAVTVLGASTDAAYSSVTDNWNNATNNTP